MPARFTGIEDDLLGTLPESFALVTEAMSRLKELLDVDSYQDMGKAEAHRVELDQLEGKLAQQLALPLTMTGDVSQAPLSVRQGWYSAYLNGWHYSESVGAADTILSTVPMKTLPFFQTHRCSPETHQSTLRYLEQILRLDESFITAAHKRNAENLARLSTCHALVSWLRQRMCSSSGALNQQLVANLFTQLFPDHPLRQHEIHVVATLTGIYWILPDMAAVGDDRRDAQTWIKRHRRFRFEQFTHFPMFCNFDSRDANQDLLASMAQTLGWDLSTIRYQLDRCMMLETGGDIDKYLIHDSWGHIWQGYLSDLTEHYDHLATMQFPINADYHIRLPDDNIVCLTDCLYLQQNGSVHYDQSLASDYIHAVINERISALLTPICAELCADIIEYSFHVDHLESTVTLPSSSLFKHRAAKLDFAWADMQYFAKALARPIRHYQKDDELRIALVHRICSLMRIKYANNAKAISKEELFTTIDHIVSQFIDQFVRIQESYFQTDFTTTVSKGSASTTAFARLFANLLRIQFAINEMYEKHLDTGHLKRQRHLINFFIVHYFQQEPAAHFWSLDEQLAAWCLPFISAIEQQEQAA